MAQSDTLKPHFNVWRVCGERKRMASRHGRFTSRSGARKWADRFCLGHEWWVRGCRDNPDCQCAPVPRAER